RTKRVRVLAGQHRVVPVLDRLRDQRRGAAGGRGATEHVVVEADAEVVMRAEPDRALGKWLVARAAFLVEVRIDADAGGEAALGRQDAVEPRAILDDRAANLEGRLLVVVHLVGKLLVRRVVGDQPRRDDVEAAGAAVIVAAGL